MNIQKVDVAVNVFGKPYQTIVAINSLLKYSGQHIHKIYLIVEKKQKNEGDIDIIKRHIQFENIEYFIPDFYFGWWPGRRIGLLNLLLSKFNKYRYSIRYQYAYEKSNKDFLFLMHNDMIFSDDLIGAYLSSIGEAVGIGKIGQCHNCPAFEIHCTPKTYTEFKPSFNELVKLYEKFPHSRIVVNNILERQKRNWPLPECRLNEFASLINLKKSRKVTIPNGSKMPPGYMGLIDIGIDWFYQLNNLGLTFKHFDYSKFAEHSWAIPEQSAGHEALFNDDLYHREEEIAKKHVEEGNY